MQRYILIIDKVSIVKLNILLNIIKQLAKAKDLISENITIFERLFIVILIKDCYQFFFIIGCLLWNKVCIKEDYYSKML